MKPGAKRIPSSAESEAAAPPLRLTRQLPSEHEAERKRREEEGRLERERLARKLARRRRAMDKILSTDEGKTIWAYLFERCGWTKPVLLRLAATGEVSPLSTEAAAAQREVYLDLRKLGSPELVAKVEFYAEHEEDKIDAAR